MKIKFTLPTDAKVDDILVGLDEDGAPYGFRVTGCDDDGNFTSLVSTFQTYGPRVFVPDRRD